MSTSFALHTVLETLESILDLFSEIKTHDGVSDFKTSSECNGLLNYFQSSEFILTAFIFIRIFDIIEHLSKIFQSRDLDVLTAVNLLNKAESKLSLLRSDEEFAVIFGNAKSYSEEHFGDFILCKTQSNRHRKRKVPRRSGELAEDEPIDNVEQYFKISVFFKTIDIILQQIHDKFTAKTISVMKDIGLLSLRRMREITKVPKDAFKKICEIYELNQESVKNEYILFKNILKDLDVHLLTELPKKLHDDSDSKDDSDDDADEIQEKGDFKNLGSLIQIFKIIKAANLKPEFENLFEIIKLSLTLPTSSCTVERSFSKLKIIKSRLRSTMQQNRLENLMVISCEHDIDIDVSKIIDIFATKTTILRKLLLS